MALYSRRKVIKLGLFGGGAILLGSDILKLATGSIRNSCAYDDLYSVIQGSLIELDAFVQIGQIYIAKYEINASLYDLLQSIFDEGDLDCLQKNKHNKKHIIELIERKMVRDYESTKTKVVDGWILSETELNLCAMLALKSQDEKAYGRL